MALSSQRTVQMPSCTSASKLYTGCSATLVLWGLDASRAAAAGFARVAEEAALKPLMG